MGGQCESFSRQKRLPVARRDCRRSVAPLERIIVSIQTGKDIFDEFEVLFQAMN